MKLFDLLFSGRKNNGLLIENNKETGALQHSVPKNQEDDFARTASLFMAGKNFNEAIQSYTILADKYPDKKGFYEAKIAMAYFFLADYSNTLKHYRVAIHHGIKKSIIDDNFWDTIDALYRQTREKGVVAEYIHIFPEGNHIKRAKKLMHTP